MYGHNNYIGETSRNLEMINGQRSNFYWNNSLNYLVSQRKKNKLA